MSMFEGVKANIEEYVPNLPKKQKKQNKEYYKLYRQKNRDKISERNRKWYEEHAGEKKRTADRARMKLKLTENPNYYRDLYRKNRQECLDAYGGKCACCGENTYEFLVIDHVFDNGKQHRAAITQARGGDVIYRWLKRNNYPTGFQVLCHNCNMAKEFYGKCPHPNGVICTRPRNKWGHPKNAGSG